MDFQERDLLKLIQETCQHPPKSVGRQKGLTQIFRFIARSGKLWQESHPDYEDAWQQMALYFCQNLCQVYDPDRSSVTTWLNQYLKRRLLDSRLRRQKQKNRFISSQIAVGDELFDILETIPSPPDIRPMLEKTRQWAETDPTGELRRTHIRGRPDVNCQFLILRRLPPETSWEAIAAQVGLPFTTLSSFYHRNCVPHLRKFAEMEGYL
ncbi:MAG: sigma-70 family RNA polymerase sigma factor [Limnospira sp.]